MIYLPHAGKVNVELQRGKYSAQWFNPRTGERIQIPDVYVDGEKWRSPDPEANNPENWPETKDWALLLTKEHPAPIVR